MDYQFKTVPYDHQLKVFNLSYNLDVYALFMEQGTGKTKVIIDTSARLFEEHAIDALVVVADNGIHRNWITDEIPAHMPDRIPLSTFIWQSSKIKTKTSMALLERLLEFDGLAMLAINIDAVITRNGSRYLQRFLKEKRCLFCIDESTSIKTPGVKRTRACIALGQRALYRRICTGTPATESPFALYSQFAFLDRSIIGIRSYFAFKHEYGTWATGTANGRNYPILVEYKNLDVLVNRIDKYSFRVLKKDCLDLPPKLYQKRYFELQGDQKKLYDELRKTGIMELKQLQQESVRVPVPLIITRMLRLQQIACGHVPNLVSNEPAIGLPDNARLDTLKTLLEELPLSTQILIWARFTNDINQICELLGNEAVRYDGQVSDGDRAVNKKRFQDGKVRYFVGNPKAGGKGLTLHAASIEIFYSNYFSLETRLHAEDRPHRIGQTKAVTIIDLVALDTIDEKIVSALRTKKKLADLITGDAPEAWL